jgi:hypothetical protein
MKSQGDDLYAIFEHHLLNALVEEESTDEFLKRVVQDYLAQIAMTGVIPNEHRATIEEDLREEVLEMLRKKTYGHYSLKTYRKSKTATATKTAVTRQPASESQDGAKSASAPPSKRSRARRFRRAN